MPKVLISDSLDNIASEILIKNNISVDTKTNLSPEELKKIIDNYDGLIIRSATKVRKDLIDSLSNLKVIGRDLIRDLTPNIPFFPGSYSTQRIDTARKGDESAYRTKETEIGALVRSLGFKFEVKSIEKLQALKAGELRRKLKALREQIQDLVNKLNRGLITQEQYEKSVDKIDVLISKTADKYDDAFSVYKIENYKQPIRIDEFIPQNIKEQTQKLFGKN